MVVNPAGHVSPYDGGVPRIVTGKAFEVISGGELCYASGAEDSVSSGLTSLAATDIGVVNQASGLLFNGVAINNVASGGNAALQTAGMVIVRAGGTIVAGNNLAANGAEDVIAAATAGHVIGRAWTGASSGAFCLMQLR